MCGICGIYGIDDDELIVRMTETLHHRGPDDFGFYRTAGVQLGHRRLSIIDLSGGKQPMISEEGSCIIIYNGEIYNYRELRDEMISRGYKFKTNSDTEVILQLYLIEGERALSKLNGMFAFAIFNKVKEELFIARDRIGIKPLYYLELPGRFLFASEAKSIFCYKDWTPTIQPKAIDDYLRLRYIPGETAMFKELKRLPAGHFLIYKKNNLKIYQYWQPPQFNNSTSSAKSEYLDELEELMKKSVKRRLISDVAFGAYLSGGLDSSVIVALMSKIVSEPVKTFSVGFDYKHDELNEAAQTARYLGCDHTEIQCRAEDVSLLPEIVYHMDEPMGDAIIIPMFKLSEEAKKQVTVILTGEGGDEIFGGYLFHKIMRMGHIYEHFIPEFIRKRGIEPLIRISPTVLMNYAFNYPAYLGNRGKQKAIDYLNLLEPESLNEAYQHLISLFDDRDTSNLYSYQFKNFLFESNSREDIYKNQVETFIKNNIPFLDRLLLLQFNHWLPDNMLLRQDKTGMAHSIEGRVPYLDHELVEFAFRLPPNLKLHGFSGKYILRKFAETILPKEVANRKKMPFYVPVENYFNQNSFQEMMADLLSVESINQRGIFNPITVHKMIKSMRNNEFMIVKQIFSLMILELWFRIFVDGEQAVY